ncbi:MAG: hypothetical protein ABIV13_02150 [Fimbriimonadales bacterium]
MKTTIFLTTLALAGATVAQLDRPLLPNVTQAEYWRAIQRTAAMVSNQQARKHVGKLGLDVMNITWEDTGRYKGSSVGPNISDMTIQVGTKNPQTRQFEVRAMPVIRFPNFSDITTDIDPQAFTLLVGNEKGGRLKRVSLYEFLGDMRSHLSEPSSWKGRGTNLLAPRDEKVLVSAQACFLPVPKEGIAEFNPVLFNYQSYEKNPAVLTILSSREGTSVTVIDNKRDAFSTGGVWGQRLFHNQDGMRASFTGQRLTDFVNSGGTGGRPVSDRQGEGLSMVLLIQVPLKQKERRAEWVTYDSSNMPMAGAKMETARTGRSDVETAVIGHGEVEGPFTEIDNLAIERDTRFPIRVTVQFYKATATGEPSEQDLRVIKDQIDRVYENGGEVGSLVVGGETGRITEYNGPKVQPTNWWESFWKRYEANTGINRIEARRRLMKMLGGDYATKPVTDLYLRDNLR